MMYIRFSNCLLLIGVTFIKCRLIEDTGRISNGIIAAPHQFPWHAAVIYLDSYEPFCGGTFIDSYWILTAEHCMPNDWIPRIMAGHVNRSDPFGTGGVIVEVEKVVKYSAENQPGDHDIALMKLKTPIFESNTIKHARLPKTEIQFEGHLAYAIGHGQTDDTGNLPLPEILLYTELRILKREECPPTYICTVEVYPKAGTCPGDSGGPLILKGTNILLGSLHAGNKPCGHSDDRSYYANIVLYLDWIQEKTGLIP